MIIPNLIQICNTMIYFYFDFKKTFNMYKLFYYEDMAQKLPDSPPPQKKIIFL